MSCRLGFRSYGLGLRLIGLGLGLGKSVITSIEVYMYTTLSRL